MQYLLRYSEIGTKSDATRRRLLGILEQNVRSAMRDHGIEADVRLKHARGWVTTQDAAAADVLNRIFGIKSFSSVETGSAAALESIVAQGKELFTPLVQDKRFAVRARRIGQHPYTSQDIEKQLGSALFDASAGVDLTEPDVTVSVEIRGKDAYFFSGRTDGPGGLPLGSQGRALVLLSGGFDSAVAAWEMMKRGVGVDYCFFNLGGPIHEEGVLRVAKTLTDTWQYGDDPTIVVIPFMGMVEHIRKQTQDNYWNLVLKKAMLKAADGVAEQRGLLALVTGDAIGQVSSQTLKNLNALGSTDAPLLRPLLTRDKDEIVMQARRIGTEELSAAVSEYCAIVPAYPVTASSRDALLAEWEKLDAEVVVSVVDEHRALSLRTLELADSSVLQGVAIDTIPTNSRIIDVREASAFNAWHVPGAERFDIHEAMQHVSSLTTERPVLFVCEHGLLSAELAHMARERGVEAASFRGGVHALRKSLSQSSVGSSGDTSRYTKRGSY